MRLMLGSRVGLLLLAFVPSLVLAQSYSGPEPEAASTAWVAAGKFCEPETVVALPDDTLLVSNVCGFNEQGNGFLSLLDADGSVLDWRAVDDLDAPLE